MSEKINGLANEETAQTQSVTVQGIISETQDLIKSFEPIKHDSILNTLLFEIKPINFREKAGIDGESERLTKKHYLICCIDEILEVAKKNHWGLCRNHDFIYLYNGCYWSLIDDLEMQTFLGKAAEKMGIDKFDAKFYSFKEQLYKQFLSTSILPKPKEIKNSVLINLLNGTFEITPTKQTIREPRSEDFLKYQLPFEFNEKAKAPIFQNFLNQVLPEVEKQMILAEFFGYLFIKQCVLKLEKTLLLYGKGSNGKSVIFEIINALLGGSQNVSNYSLNSLTDEKGYHRANLANKLLNYASEISGNLEASLFKQLVSGEPIEARLPYCEPFILTDYAKLVFNCNELPFVTEHTHAFFRRFTIIPFDVTIEEKDQDRELANKIIDNELSGVFNWVLEGLRRLLENKKITYCEAVNNQLELYKKQSDTVQLFLDDDHYLKSVDEYMPLQELYLFYRCYCSESGYKACSKKTFSERLKNISFTIERKSYGMAIYAKKSI
jgi:putative DNA primase/helicase